MASLKDRAATNLNMVDGWVNLRPSVCSRTLLQIIIHCTLTLTVAAGSDNTVQLSDIFKHDAPAAASASYIMLDTLAASMPAPLAATLPEATCTFSPDTVPFLCPLTLPFTGPAAHCVQSPAHNFAAQDRAAKQCTTAPVASAYLVGWPTPLYMYVPVRSCDRWVLGRLVDVLACFGCFSCWVGVRDTDKSFSVFFSISWPRR